MTIKTRKQKNENFRRNERLTEFLGVLTPAAFLGVVIAVPIIPFVLKPFLKNDEVKFSLKEIKRLSDSLKRNNYISIEKNGDIHVTKKGNLFYKIKSISQIIIKIPKNWDKKYRLVIFDISNKKKFARETLRKFLIGTGFFMLQESVFILPYPCEKEVREVAEILDIWDEVNILKVENVDKEEFLLKHFHLS